LLLLLHCIQVGCAAGDPNACAAVLMSAKEAAERVQHKLQHVFTAFLATDAAAAARFAMLLVTLMRLLLCQRAQRRLLHVCNNTSYNRMSFCLSCCCCCQVGRAAGDPDASAAVLMSAKEAAELEELLASFDMGLGEADAFAAALQVMGRSLVMLHKGQAQHVKGDVLALVQGVLVQLRHTQQDGLAAVALHQQRQHQKQQQGIVFFIHS
jgi:hypothetical protein